MNRRLLLVLIAAVSLAPAGFAHGPKGSKPAGANGGQIADVDGGHLELVVTPVELRLYVTDLSDAPLPSADLSARAIILDGSRQLTVPLAPRTPNLLVGTLAAPLGADAKIAVSTTLARDGKPVQARFVVK